MAMATASAMGTGANGIDLNAETKPKETVNYEKSGLLAQASNTYKGMTLKYAEPPEARLSTKQKWRLYVFKGEELLGDLSISCEKHAILKLYSNAEAIAIEMLPVAQQSAYLFGREREVVDIPTDHPSCSKQHAVLQYREIILPADLSKHASSGSAKDAFRDTSVIRSLLFFARFEKWEVCDAHLISFQKHRRSRLGKRDVLERCEAEEGKVF